MFASWLLLSVIKKESNTAALYAVWTIVMLGALQVYRFNRIKKLSWELRNVVLGNLIAVVTLSALLFLFRLQEFSRGVLGIYYVSVVSTMVGKRLVLRNMLRYYLARGYNLKHHIVVCGVKLAKRYL